MINKILDKFNESSIQLDKKRTERDYAVEVEDLVVHYETERSTVKAVNGVDFKLKKKSILGIVGETGAGKSTTMLSILRLIQSPPGEIKSGKIFVNGLDMLSLNEQELGAVRGSEIAMIFQDPMTALNPVMTVGDQIAESIFIHEGISKSEALERAKEMLEVVGIDSQRYGEYPHQFSGGMRQRVGIAIALACRPSVLIADEPTTALDVTIQDQVLELMKNLKQKYDTSLLLITHDLGVVAQMCDEVAVMYAGSIIERGTVEDIFNRTKHPYTEGLFNSLPNINNRVAHLKSIDGFMPNPSNLPEGCSFASRCPYANESCQDKPMEMIRISNTHEVKCAAYKNPNFSIQRKVV